MFAPRKLFAMKTDAFSRICGTGPGEGTKIRAPNGFQIVYPSINFELK
jgi:hypothetical protein